MRSPAKRLLAWRTANLKTLAASGLWAGLLALTLAGCASRVPPLPAPQAPPLRQLATLLPADLIILGEQHDAPEHHQLEAEVVSWLAARGRLAGVVLEMADANAATAQLPRDASEEQVRHALDWQEEAWPWQHYSPSIMAAVRAGAPVVGANLPRARMREAMEDVSLDAQLSPAALRAQRAAVRDGHCGLLPETQIGPMTRIQIARDRSMAQGVLAQRRPGRTLVLITGAGHATRELGVPQHLPSDLALKTVLMHAGAAGDTAAPPGAYDTTWATAPLPARDACAPLRERARG